MCRSYSAVLFLCILQIIITAAYFEDIIYKDGDVAHYQHKRSVHEELLYSTSKVFQRQIAVYNSSAQVGIVIDSLGEKVAILNGETGRGVVIDKVMRMGVVVEMDGWLNIQVSLKDYLKDCNVSAIMDRNSKYSFQLEDDDTLGHVIKQIMFDLSHFGVGLIERILEAGGDLLKAILDLFAYIMHPLKNVIGPVIEMAVVGWILITGGILALLNTFLSIGKLVAFIAGGIVKLTSMAIRFPLTVIITALDGVRAFCVMLRELMNFDLIKLLGAILTLPAQIATFIAGLGGAVALGITGLFYIFAKIFEFSIKGVVLAIKGFFKILMAFFAGKRPLMVEVQSSSKMLLTVAEENQRRFHNNFGEYKRFIGAVEGTSNYEIKGVAVRPLVRLLTSTVQNSESLMLKVITTLRPVIPFQGSLPHLMTSIVRLLDQPDGASMVERMFPVVRLPTAASYNVKSNYLGAMLRSNVHPTQSLTDLKGLPTHELLQRLPVVSAIYREIDAVARTYDNTTLAELLRNSDVTSELEEVTFRALGV